MAYQTGLIRDQWFCLNGGERYCCWLMAAAKTADQTCVDTAALDAVLLSWYPTDFTWRDPLFYSQFRVPYVLGTEDPCIGKVVILADVPFLDELLEGVANGDLPPIVSPDDRCREVRGFP